MKGRIKSFKELMAGVEDPGEVEITCTDEEAEIRAQVFLNGYEAAEQCSRRLINNISFQLNKKALEGCQAKDLIQFYNERIGGLLDDFIY